MHATKSWIYSSLVVMLTMAWTGCPAPPIEIGPFRLDIPLGSMDIPQDLISGKQLSLSYTFDKELCNLLSEEDINTLFTEAAGVDLSSLVRMSRFELAGAALTATQGDFSFLSAITLRYIPKPVNGVEQQAVILGAASDNDGFGTVIELLPVGTVDFLDLIQANDANTGEGCPTLEIEATPRSLPTSKVSLDAVVSIDAYAEIFPD